MGRFLSHQWTSIENGSSVTNAHAMVFVSMNTLCVPCLLGNRWDDSHQTRNENGSSVTNAHAMIFISSWLAWIPCVFRVFWEIDGTIPTKLVTKTEAQWPMPMPWYSLAWMTIRPRCLLRGSAFSKIPLPVLKTPLRTPLDRLMLVALLTVCWFVTQECRWSREGGDVPF